MARPTTLSPDWQTLAQAVGGIEQLKRELGWGTMVFFRRTRNLVSLPRADRLLVETLAARHKVPSPLPPAPPQLPAGLDLTPLELAGKGLALGFPIAKNAVRSLRETYTDDQLVIIADTETSKADVLRAATYLLELE